MPKIPGQEAPEEREPLSSSDRLAGDWEPGNVPMAEDGRPDAKRLLREVVFSKPSPSLCTYGPCERYHELVVQMDNAQPVDGSTGDAYGVKIRTCYPAVGIEFPLDIAIWDCNRWDPSGYNRAQLRDDFDRHLKLWRDGEEKRKADELAEAERFLLEIEAGPPNTANPSDAAQPEDSLREHRDPSG